MSAQSNTEINTSRVHVFLDDIGAFALSSLIERYAVDLPSRAFPLAVVTIGNFYAWFALDSAATVVWGARKTKGWASRDALAFLRGERPELFIQ